MALTSTGRTSRGCASTASEPTAHPSWDARRHRGGSAAGRLRRGPDQRDASPRARKSQRVRYGDQDAQFADLRLPDGDPVATLVLLHGGYWQPGYGLELMNPLAEKFTDLGYATWNVEYRHTGDHYADTLSDVAAAVGPAGSTPARPRAWTGTSSSSATRPADTSPPGPPPARPPPPAAHPRSAVRGAVSLSGVLDLTRAAADPLSLSPVIAFMGGTPAEVPDDYAVADPALLVPASCPVWAVHAADDQVVSPRAEHPLRRRGPCRRRHGEGRHRARRPLHPDRPRLRRLPDDPEAGRPGCRLGAGRATARSIRRTRCARSTALPPTAPVRLAG